MEKFKIIIVFLLVLMLVAGVYFFINLEKTEERREVEFSFSATGNLIINNPGLESGKWYLVFDKEGAPGVTKSLTIKEDDIVCKGEEKDCSDFFSSRDDIAGARVKIEGEEDGSDVIVYDIEFLEN